MRNPKGKELLLEDTELAEIVIEAEDEDIAITDLVTFTESKVDPYIEHEHSRYHKSNLVNNFLNNMTKLSSDRLSAAKVPSHD